MGTELMETIDKPRKVNGIDKWEAESAADTLTRSFEIKKQPKVLAAALKIIRDRQKAAKAALGWAGGLSK